MYPIIINDERGLSLLIDKLANALSEKLLQKKSTTISKREAMKELGVGFSQLNKLIETDELKVDSQNRVFTSSLIDYKHKANF